MLASLEQDLRAYSPELFDGRGRLRKRALVAQLSRQFGSATIEGDEITPGSMLPERLTPADVPPRQYAGVARRAKHRISQQKAPRRSWKLSRVA